MPTFKYEAMDTTGDEVKDSIDATNEEEAQQKIKSDGLLRHQAHGAAGGKKAARRRRRQGRQEAARPSPSAASRSKQLCTFTRQFSTLQDAGLPVLRSLRSSKAR